MTKVIFIALCSLFSHQIFSGGLLNEVTTGLEYNEDVAGFSPTTLIIRYDGTPNKAAKEINIPIRYNGDSNAHDEAFDNLSLSLASIRSDDQKNSKSTEINKDFITSIISMASKLNFTTATNNLKNKNKKYDVESIRRRYYSKIGIDT